MWCGSAARRQSLTSGKRWPRGGVCGSTVLTMLARLEEKGWLCCDQEGHAFRYRAAVPRETTLGTVVRRLVDSAFGGSAEGLVLARLHGRNIEGGSRQDQEDDRSR